MVAVVWEERVELRYRFVILKGKGDFVDQIVWTEGKKFDPF
jgi:hypothetical protein